MHGLQRPVALIPPFEKGGLGGISTTSAHTTAVKSPPAPLLQRGECSPVTD